MSRQLQSRPKKRFGQHFLRDTGILDRIVQRLNPVGENLFLEVGAGYGALSRRLAPLAGKLVAIEVDRDQIPQLTANLSPFPSAIVLCADIFSLDLMQIISKYLRLGLRLRIVGNLPYNIATAIIERFLVLSLPAEDMNFLVQLEVAQRMVAVPGTKQYGYFSVLCQYHSEVELGFRVRPGVFWPPPKVMSALVTLRPRRRVPDHHLDDAVLLLARAAFAHRRKSLWNSFRLARAPVQIRMLDLAGIKAGARAEELSVEDYIRLALVYLLNPVATPPC